MFDLRISQHFISSKKAPAKPPNLGQSRCRLHRSDHRMCRRSGVRVSAPLRRGAAPYADGCERFSGHSHLISLLLFAVLSDLRRGFYVTFRDTQCTIKSTLQYPFRLHQIATPPFSKDLAPTYPSLRTPRRNPGVVPIRDRRV